MSFHKHMAAAMRHGSDDQVTSDQPEMYTAVSPPESRHLDPAVSFAYEVAFFLCAVAFGFVVMATWVKFVD
jgi:hypothetical protein